MQKTHAGLILLFLTLLSLGSHSIAQSPGNAPASFHMTGTTELLSHYVEHGVSQTKKAPSLQASFWFNFGPQARLGLWGSNVSFENEDAHFLLRPTLDVKINITNNADLGLSYSQNKYFNSGSRDGNIVGLNLGIFGYHVKYEMLSNWEGTSSGATYFSLGRVYDYTTWKWENELGYSMLKTDGYSNYFDVRTFVGRSLAKIYGQIGLTGTSANSQFNSAGGYFLVVKLSTEF